MDTVKIINYTRLPNLVILLLGLLQPGEYIALPVLEDDPDLEVLLPYLKYEGIEILWYHKKELTRPQHDSCLADVLLLPVQWVEYFPVLCKYQHKKNTLILLKCVDKEENLEAIPKAMEVVQIYMYNESLKNSTNFCISYRKGLLPKLQRLSNYDMVVIPSFLKNDR